MMSVVSFTLNDITQIILDLLEIDPASNNVQIHERSHFVEDLGMNSLALVSLVFLIEDALSIDLSDKAEDLANLKTVGATLTYLQAIA